MGTFRLRTVALAVTALAACLPVLAADTLSYEQLRKQHPAIDEAVDGLADGGLHGALDEVSRLLRAGDVLDLPEGSSEALSGKFTAEMTEAIERVSDRLVAAEVDALPLSDRHVLLQVLDAVVFERNVGLHADASWAPCEAEEPCDVPTVLQALDALAQQVVPVITALVLDYEEISAGDPSMPAPPLLLPDDEYHSQSFGSQVDQLCETWGYVRGEPSIDP